MLTFFFFQITNLLVKQLSSWPQNNELTCYTPKSTKNNIQDEIAGNQTRDLVVSSQNSDHSNNDTIGNTVLNNL